MNCIFCNIAAHKIPADIIAQAPTWMAFLDIKPVRKGHVLIIPTQHVNHLGDLAYNDMAPTLAGVQSIMKAVMKSMGADGAFVATNTIVSQSVPHLHFHVIPRNFKDGLRGFFWPRIGYDSDEEKREVAKKIQLAFSSDD